jgi:hypothetical protein
MTKNTRGSIFSELALPCKCFNESADCANTFDMLLPSRSSNTFTQIHSWQTLWALYSHRYLCKYRCRMHLCTQYQTLCQIANWNCCARPFLIPRNIFSSAEDFSNDLASASMYVPLFLLIVCFCFVLCFCRDLRPVGSIKTLFRNMQSPTLQI